MQRATMQRNEPSLGRSLQLSGGLFGAVHHAIPMSSIDSTFAAEELGAWDARVQQSLGITGAVEYTAEPKFYGVSVSLRYEDGILVRAGTRGDGRTGEEAKRRLATNGARATESVTAETDYVVVGEAPGAKAERARALGVKTPDEKQFLKLIGT